MDQNCPTLKPPAVPILMIKSGFSACTAAKVIRADGTVPTLSTPKCKTISKECKNYNLILKTLMHSFHSPKTKHFPGTTMFISKPS